MIKHYSNTYKAILTLAALALNGCQSYRPSPYEHEKAEHYFEVVDSLSIDSISSSDTIKFVAYSNKYNIRILHSDWNNYYDFKNQILTNGSYVSENQFRDITTNNLFNGSFRIADKSDYTQSLIYKTRFLPGVVMVSLSSPCLNGFYCRGGGMAFFDTTGNCIGILINGPQEYVGYNSLSPFIIDRETGKLCLVVSYNSWHDFKVMPIIVNDNKILLSKPIAEVLLVGDTSLVHNSSK